MISGLLAEWTDSVAIPSIVFLNAVLGFIQELRARKSLEALKRITALTSRVVRGGESHMIPSLEVVPGDIVELEAGDIVPADVRLISLSRFSTQEASLTGESVPVQKAPEVIPQVEVALADRKNMAFMGTSAVSGKARAVVVATGMNTELGRIAGLLRRAEERLTPLQERLEEFGRRLVYLCIGVVAVVFLMAKGKRKEKEKKKGEKKKGAGYF
jgi:Ca2+-transporting ATPase